MFGETAGLHLLPSLNTSLHYHNSLLSVDFEITTQSSSLSLPSVSPSFLPSFLSSFLPSLSQPHTLCCVGVGVVRSTIPVQVCCPTLLLLATTKEGLDQVDFGTLNPTIIFVCVCECACSIRLVNCSWMY